MVTVSCQGYLGQDRRMIARKGSAHKRAGIHQHYERLKSSQDCPRRIVQAEAEERAVLSVWKYLWKYFV